MGYGWAGLFRKFLVDSPYMWWPGNLVQVSLFRFALSASHVLTSILYNIHVHIQDLTIQSCGNGIGIMNSLLLSKKKERRK